MAVIEYYTGGKLQRLSVQSVDQLTSPPPKATRKSARMATPSALRTISFAAFAPQALEAVQGQADRFGALLGDMSDAAMRLAAPAAAGGPAVVPTASLVVEGANKAELKKLKDEFGVNVVDEGSNGKVLLQASVGGEEGIKIAAAAARKAFERGNVDAAHPNFIRVMSQVKPSAAGDAPLWNHTNDGNPGVPGADVAAAAAWIITKGKADIRVAVLDEGVDPAHPDLKAAIVAQKDFVAGNPTAAPDGNDSHGTECSGVIVSRSGKYPGLAPACSLVAVRIAKGDGRDGWVFDDFKTADAIDWAWNEGQADVLSNSWGGGPPVDVITRAFDRARTNGRKKKGAVVVIATGNNDGPVGFPATLPNVLAVGASNQWDERKSKTSKDGESWWGSNYGAEINLVAPGVRIATTNIHGAAGDGPSDYSLRFNGTSSATPHVAAAAALILSVMPSLDEKRVREIITASADRLTKDGQWDKFVGWGRLNIYAALRLARR
jgi:subtilisin family serine protease